MGIKAKDLHPTKSNFTLGDKEYTLRAFDLAAEVWAYSKFATDEQPNGLLALGEAMQTMDNIGPAMQLAYHLLEEKDFPTFLDFSKAVQANGKYAKIVQIYHALTRSIGLSQQQMEDLEGELELKKPLRAMA